MDKNNCDLYCDDGQILLRNTNGQKRDKTRRLVIKTFNYIAFKIDIKTNLEIVDFLGVTFNLNKGTYSPYKKSSDKILYINTLSNHP